MFIASVVLLLLGCSVQIAVAVDEYQFVSEWDLGSSNSGLQPAGIAADTEGNIYVVVSVAGRSAVRKYRDDGTPNGTWACIDPVNGEPFHSDWIAVGSGGAVYVTDQTNNKVRKYSADGSPIAVWGGWVPGVGKLLNFPSGIAVDAEGAVYVCEYMSSRVTKFSAGGAVISRWGGNGPDYGGAGGDPGQFHGPQGIAVDKEGNVYVSDFLNSRVQKFTTNGTYLAQWYVNYPRGIAVDSKQRVHVTSQGGNYIAMFNSKGTLLNKLGGDGPNAAGSGTGDGQFNLPFGLTVDNEDYVYVTDVFNTRIQKLSVPDRFQANPDGFQFVNWGQPVTSWELFKSTFGADEVEFFNGNPSPSAESFYYLYGKSASKNGICGGMASSSLLLWSNEMPGQQAWELGSNPDVRHPGWGVFSQYPVTATISDWVASYQLRQIGEAWNKDRMTGYPSSPSYTNNIGVFNALKESMAEDSYSVNPFVLVLNYDWEAARGEWKSCHAVVPIDVEVSDDKTTGTIIYYDPNHVGMEFEDITINLITGAASFETDNQVGLDVMRLSVYLQEPNLPNWFIGTAPNAHLLMTDPSGNRLGYDADRLVSEIPDAMQVVPVNGGGDIPEAYYLGNGPYATELIGTGTGIASTTLHRPDGFVMVNASVNPGSLDEFRFGKADSSVEFVSGSGTESLELTIDLETANDARIARVSGISVDPSKSVGIAFTQSGDSISIVNTGGAASVKVSLEQVGASPSVFIPSRLLDIDAMSSVRITPSDWAKLDQTLLSVEYDVGNDGTVDRSGNLAPEGYLSASFVTNVTMGIAPLAVQFTDTSTGFVAEWHWEFGDGMSSTEHNPVHVYSVPGTHTATLTVKAEGGVTDSKNAAITVKSPAEATAELLAAVQNLDLPSDIRTGLTDKLNAAIEALNRGNGKAATGSLNAFINQVNAQSGKAISSADADALIMGARTILTAITGM